MHSFKITNILFPLWAILLVPSVYIGMFAPMLLDDESHLSLFSWISFFAAVSFPVALLIAAIIGFRIRNEEDGKYKWWVYLPFLNFLIFFLGSSFLG